MEAREEKIGAVITVALKGRLDSASSLSLEERLVRLVRAGETRMVVDFSETEFVGAAALRAVILAARCLEAAEGRLAACALPPPVREAFEVAGLGTLVPVFATREEALRAVGQGGRR